MQYTKTLVKEFGVPEGETRQIVSLVNSCIKGDFKVIDKKIALLGLADQSEKHMRLFRKLIGDGYNLETSKEVSDKIKEWRCAIRSKLYQHLPIVVRERAPKLNTANIKLIEQNPKIDFAIIDGEGFVTDVITKHVWELTRSEFDRVYTEKGKVRSPEEQSARWRYINKKTTNAKVTGNVVQVNGERNKTLDELMDYVDKITSSCKSQTQMAKYKERIMASAKRCKL